MHKGLQPATKRVANEGGEDVQLTQAEQDVAHLLSKEFLTARQIAIRRKTSTQAIYKIIKSLKKKGGIDKGNNMVAKTHCSMQPSQPIRLHSEEFNIQIIYKDERYRKKIGQFLTIDGNTVRCYRDSIELYSNTSFWGDTVQHATNKSMQYWTRFLNRLEHDLNIILIKPRSQNIRMVNYHYAETNNEIAVEHEVKGLKLRVYAQEDGKLWAEIDNSFNLKELETRHPQTAKEDAEVVIKHLNDWRNNPDNPTLSEMSKLLQETIKQLNDMAKHNKESAAGLSSIIEYLKSQIPYVGEQMDNEKAEYIG